MRYFDDNGRLKEQFRKKILNDNNDKKPHPWTNYLIKYGLPHAMLQEASNNYHKFSATSDIVITYYVDMAYNLAPDFENSYPVEKVLKNNLTK